MKRPLERPYSHDIYSIFLNLTKKTERYRHVTDWWSDRETHTRISTNYPQRVSLGPNLQCLTFWRSGKVDVEAAAASVASLPVVR